LPPFCGRRAFTEASPIESRWRLTPAWRRRPGKADLSCAKRYDLSRNLIRIWVQRFEAGALDEDAVAADLIRSADRRPRTPRRQAGAGAGVRKRGSEKRASASLARRYLELHDEIADLDAMIAAIVDELAPNLVARNSIGHIGAAQLLLTAGDNPERLRSEASFASLCGVSPVPASSGKTVRHRLNRGGDRAANSALHITSSDDTILPVSHSQALFDYITRDL
jgi:hypothetical protein